MTDPIKPKRKVTAQIPLTLNSSPSTFSSFPPSTASSAASSSTSVPKVRARVDPAALASVSAPRSTSPTRRAFSPEPPRPRLRSTASSTSLRSVLSGSSGTARVKSPTQDSGFVPPVPPLPPLPRDVRSETPTAGVRAKVSSSGVVGLGFSNGRPMSPPLTSPSLSNKQSMGSLPKVKAPLTVKMTNRTSDALAPTPPGSGSSRSTSPVPAISKSRPPINREHTPEHTPNRPPSRAANRVGINAAGGIGMARVKSSPISDITKNSPGLPITPTHPPLRARARSRAASNASELHPPSPSALDVASMPMLSPSNLLQVSPTNNPGGWTSRVPSPHEHPRGPSPSPRHLSPSPTRAFFDPPSASPSRGESPVRPPLNEHRTSPSTPGPPAISSATFASLTDSRPFHPNASAPTTPSHNHSAFLPDYGASQGRLASSKKPLPVHPHVMTNPGPPTPSSPVLRTVELPVSTPRGSNEWNRGALNGGGNNSGGTPGVTETPGVIGLLNRQEDLKKDGQSRLSGSTAVDSSPQSPSMDDEGRQKSLILNFQSATPEIAVMKIDDVNGSPDQGIDVVLEAEKEAVKEARINRKIADLEISNASLLAINKSLEATKSKQRAEILKLRRALRESLAGGTPQLSKGKVGTLLGPSPLADGVTADEDEDDDLDEFDPEAEAEMDQRWEKISRAMDSIVRRGQEAIAQSGSDVAASGGRVLGWDEVQSAAPSSREGSATPEVW